MRVTLAKNRARDVLCSRSVRRANGTVSLDSDDLDNEPLDHEDGDLLRLVRRGRPPVPFTCPVGKYVAGLKHRLRLTAETRQESQKRCRSSVNQSPTPCRLELAVITHSQLRFEQRGPELLAVEIGQRSCAPLIGSVHRALFALGLDISSYRARTEGGGLVEHLVLERHGGGCIDGALSAEAKAAILPLALGVHATEGCSEAF